jgi:RNA polymerase sigma-70 factor (ECF subfamily)
VPHVAILAAPLQCTELTGNSEDRFADFMRRRSRFVFQVAWAVLRNAHDAEDVAQETFLKLYRTGAWEHMSDEKAFLAKAAWRVAVSKARGRRTSELLDDETAPRCGAANPERLAIAVDMKATVERLIDGLPEDLRLPLALSAIEEMTAGAIGEAMGIPEGTVRSRIVRAREILRKKLEAL